MYKGKDGLRTGNGLRKRTKDSLMLEHGRKIKAAKRTVLADNTNVLAAFTGMETHDGGEHIEKKKRKGRERGE